MKTLFTNTGEMLAYEAYQSGAVADFINEVKHIYFKDSVKNLTPVLRIDDRYRLDNGVTRYILEFEGVTLPEEILLYVKF